MSSRSKHTTGIRTPRCIEVDGLKLPPYFSPETFREACNYKPDPGRVVVATYPKCGTTWTVQIVILILRKGVPPTNAEEYFHLAPFIEMVPARNLSKDSCIKTHLPFDKINFSDQAKYIYVTRHPADCAVSSYHHMRYFPTYFFSDGTFDDFFETFISGNSVFGDYFDHLLSWSKARNKPNVLYIAYEALKADPRSTILKIAKFMGDSNYETLVASNEMVLKKILAYSSRDFMMSTINRYWYERINGNLSEEAKAVNPVDRNYAQLLMEATREGHKSIGNFIRKRGGVDDRDIVLSDVQKERLQLLIRERCAECDLIKLWEA